ncbi:MAG: aminoacyl-tRNA hydrolase [Acidobacteria bacterium]|nr:MAG: aminoacyl-tRNA hydrolase [Acidobacteriota bacterium]
MIRINDDVTIEERELNFEYARSSGPGGQNVNKVETKATLRFSLTETTSLTDEQKDLIRERLPGRITKKDVLRVMCQRHRTREANRKECFERFATLLADALTEDPERRPTRVPRKTKRRRLEDKKRRSRIKASRGPVERE